MAEAGDAGIAPSEIAPAAVFGPHHQLDRIAGGVAENHHVPDLAQLALLRRPAANAVAQALELRARLSRSAAAATSKATAWSAGSPRNSRGCGAGVRPATECLCRSATSRPRISVAKTIAPSRSRSQSAIADIAQIDHLGSPSAAYSIMAPRSTRNRRNCGAWANCLGRRSGWSGANHSPSATYPNATPSTPWKVRKSWPRLAADRGRAAASPAPTAASRRSA